MITFLAGIIERLLWLSCVASKDDLQCRLIWSDGSMNAMAHIVVWIALLVLFTGFVWTLLLWWERRRIRHLIRQPKN